MKRCMDFGLSQHLVTNVLGFSQGLKMTDVVFVFLLNKNNNNNNNNYYPFPALCIMSEGETKRDHSPIKKLILLFDTVLYLLSALETCFYRFIILRVFLSSYYSIRS